MSKAGDEHVRLTEHMFRFATMLVSLGCIMILLSFLQYNDIIIGKLIIPCTQPLCSGRGSTCANKDVAPGKIYLKLILERIPGKFQPGNVHNVIFR